MINELNVIEEEDAVNELNELNRSGYLSQPRSMWHFIFIMTYRTNLVNEIRVRKKHRVSEETVRKWLASSTSIKRFYSLDRYANTDVDGTLWINEKQYENKFNPLSITNHPIDVKRIESLSDLWNQ